METRTSHVIKKQNNTRFLQKYSLRFLEGESYQSFNIHY